MKSEKQRETKQYKEFVNEILGKLENRNIADHLKKLNALEKAQQKYFYFVSPMWKAIQKHIGSAEDCVLVERDENYIISYRGHGPAVRLKSVYLNEKDFSSNPPKDINLIRFEIEVEYFADGEERSENPKTYKKNYWLWFPSDLELNFTQAKFDNWVKKEKVKRDAEVKKTELEEFERLKKKYSKKSARNSVAE